MMLVREDRHRVAHQRHVVGHRDARRLHRSNVTLGVLRRLVAQTERLDAAALVLHLLRLGQRLAQIVEDVRAGGTRGISADRHLGSGAARGAHLGACVRDALLTGVQRVEPARLSVDRAGRRGDVGAQGALVPGKIARVDAGAPEPVAQLVDTGGLFLERGAELRRGLPRLRQLGNHLL
nr:hypothetical protein [Burkholderia gladioli]